MNCFKYLLKRLRDKEDERVSGYNDKVARDIQSHWKDHTIEVRELIWERKANVGERESKNFDYVVFIDIAGDLDWICDDDHSQKHLTSRSSTLIARALSIEALPCKQLAEEQWMAFKRMLGAAIVSALEESFGDAETFMEQAQSYLRGRTEERSRMWTLLDSTVLLIVFSSVLLMEVFDSVRVPFLFGLFGAYVSTVRSSGKRRTDASAGFFLHLVEACVRLMAGMILGLVGVQLFNCSLAPEVARSLCATDAGIRTVAFCAGLLDHFIPSMISAYVLKPLEPKGNSND